MKCVAWVAALVSTTTIAAAARAQSASPVQLFRPNPDDSVHVDAYLGIDYASLGRDNENFHVRGLSLDPYVLKTANVSVTNLSHFDFALNAAATSLLGAGGFTSPGNTPMSNDEKQAQRYAALLSYAFSKKLKLRTEAHYAHMATYLTPQFHLNADFPSTTYYVPASGPMSRMHPGQGIGGFTDWYAAAIDVVGSGSLLGLDADYAFGYRIFQLDTLSPYAVETQQSSPLFQAIVADTLTCNALSLDANIHHDLFDTLSVEGQAYFIGGYARQSSALVDGAGGVCWGEGINAAFVYRRPFLSVTLGVWMDQVGAAVWGGNTLAQTVLYNDYATGRVTSSTKGTTLQVEPPTGLITSIGPYLHISAHF